jgi:nicotinamidase-related amidase
MKKINNVTIYENLKEVIDPEHTCLVVWDVQNALVERIFNKNEFVENLKNFIDKMRNKMPVFYTKITPLKSGFQSSWSYYTTMKNFGISAEEASKMPHFMSKVGARDIYAAVSPKQEDIVIEKSTASIFIGTDFEQMLRNRNITTIIFSGISTEIGIESSARDASNRGFYPVIASDCVSSSDKEAHECSLKILERMVIVKNSKEIMTNV